MANNEEMMQDFENEGTLITLTDDEGNEVEFEFLDVIEYDGDEYIVLIENDEDADEVVILKINALDEETEEYVSIDDDEILETVFDMFKKKYEGEIEFELTFTIYIIQPPVAQPDNATDSDSGDWGFKSLRAGHKRPIISTKARTREIVIT